MKLSKISLRILLVFAIISLALFLIFLLNFKFNLFKQREAARIIFPPISGIIVPHESEKIIYGLPINLNISEINVDTAVENVGITESGAMDMPKSIDTVGWYFLGSRPGENGSAVIAGHYGKKNGRNSIFNNISKLNIGDKIFIEDDRGQLITFVIREIKILDPKADTSDVFISNDGKAHLNLITCEGTWNKITKSYSGRLVVFSDKE